MHTLADGAHDSCGHLSLLEDLSLRELVVVDGQLGPDILEFVRLKEERQGLTDSILANRLVQTVFLEVLFYVKDRDRLCERLLHLNYLSPKHRRLVFLSAVAVVINTVVIGALRLVFVPAVAPPEEAA